MVRNSPSESATLYKLGAKRKGNDGNMWIIVANVKGIKRWKLNRKIVSSPKNTLSSPKEKKSSPKNTLSSPKNTLSSLREKKSDFETMKEIIDKNEKLTKSKTDAFFSLFNKLVSSKEFLHYFLDKVKKTKKLSMYAFFVKNDLKIVTGGVDEKSEAFSNPREDFKVESGVWLAFYHSFFYDSTDILIFVHIDHYDVKNNKTINVKFDKMCNIFNKSISTVFAFDDTYKDDKKYKPEMLGSAIIGFGYGYLFQTRNHNFSHFKIGKSNGKIVYIEFF